ncbi:DUF1453 domain-containing protein [Streptomyces tubercidicus]
MNGWLLAAVIAIITAVVIAKRLRGEPVNARELFIAPLVLIAIGVTTLAKADHLTGGDVAWATAGAALGCTLGALRGATVQLFARDGVPWQRYTGRTILVAALSLLTIAGYGLLATKLGMHENARPIQLAIGISFLGESLAVAHRGLTTGTPFATERGRH